MRLKTVRLHAFVLFALLLCACRSSNQSNTAVTTVVPLDTTDPSLPFSDLQPFSNAIGNSHIILLGEASHGTHEFFTLKDRLFRYLVNTHGVRVLTAEVAASSTVALDGYIQSGAGDVEALVRGLHFWTMATQETVSMVSWMRTYNSTHSDTVHFIGIDMQSPAEAMREVLGFLSDIDPAEHAYAASDYRCFSSYADTDTSLSSYSSSDAAQIASCKADVANVRKYLEGHIDQWSKKMSRNPIDNIIYVARTVEQAQEMYAAKAFIDQTHIRDKAMADNVEWVWTHMASKQPAVVWAHNAHIEYGQGDMGFYLKARYGRDVRSFGLDFYDGVFIAIGGDGRVDVLQAAEPPEGSYEELAHDMGYAVALINFGRNDDIWQGIRQYHSLGAGIYATQPVVGLETGRWPKLFDAVLYVEKSTPSEVLLH